MPEVWEKHVPDSASPPVAKPIEFDKYLQENIPVHKEVVTTAAGGVTVTLPSAFASEISAASEYVVSATLQEAPTSETSLYPSDKTTADFKLQNSQDEAGLSVLVLVFWNPS